jgi:hypothetical protein
MNRPRFDRTLLFLLCGMYAALLLVQFSPGLFTASNIAPGAYFDVYHFIWNLWFLGQPGEESSHYFTRLVFWPSGTSLYLHTLTEGIAWPMAHLFSDASPWWVYAASCVACLFLNWLSFALLFSQLSINRISAGLLASALALHPFWYAHLDGGHLNMLAFFPIPLCLYCIVKSHCEDHSKYRYTWTLGAALCVAFLPYTNLYYFYFLLLLLVSLGLYGMLSRRPRLLRTLITVVGVGILVSGWRLYATAAAAFSGEFAPNHNPMTNSLNLAHLIIPGTYQFISGLLSSIPTYTESPNSSEIAGYIGVSLGIALTYLLLRSRLISARLCVLAMLAFIALALGPSIHWGDHSPVFNPLFRALSWLPLFPSVPARFVSIALLAAFCALALFSREHPRLVCLVAVACAVEWFPKPIFWRSEATSPLLERLRDSSISALHDVSPALELRMLHQTVHHKPITAGFLARAPRKQLRQVRRNPLITFLEGRSDNYPFDRVRDDMQALRIEALLVPTEASEGLRRARTLSALRESDHDEFFALFRLP